MTTKKSPLQMVGIKQLSKVVKNIHGDSGGVRGAAWLS